MRSGTRTKLAQGAIALGAYRIISKPFEIDSLAALVRQAREDGGVASTGFI